LPIEGDVGLTRRREEREVWMGDPDSRHARQQGPTIAVTTSNGNIDPEEP